MLVPAPGPVQQENRWTIAGRRIACLDGSRDEIIKTTITYTVLCGPFDPGLYPPNAVVRLIVKILHINLL